MSSRLREFVLVTVKCSQTLVLFQRLLAGDIKLTYWAGSSYSQFCLLIFHCGCLLIGLLPQISLGAMNAAVLQNWSKNLHWAVEDWWGRQLLVRRLGTHPCSHESCCTGLRFPALRKPHTLSLDKYLSMSINTISITVCQN